MKHVSVCRCLALWITPCLLALAPGGTPAQIKCWTNKHGERECGDTIPPEYSQQGHEVIDKRGFVIQEKGRALTPEEAEKKALKEKARQEQEILLEAQKRRDRVLLDTFFEEGDIVRARDSKVSTIVSTIRLENDRVTKLENNLGKLKEREQKYREKEQDVPERVAQSIQELEKQIVRAKQYIVEKDEERKRIEKTYADYLKRFKELSGTSPPPGQSGQPSAGAEDVSPQ